MITVPDQLAASYAKHAGEAGRAWIADLPALAATMLEQWSLTVDGPAGHGMASLVLPVTRAGGRAAVLKLQQPTVDNAAAAVGLRTWAGNGIVRLYRHDPDTGTMLLERLDATRPLSTVPDDTAALTILADLLARLVAVAAPPGVRRLADVAAAMLEQLPRALPALSDPTERELLRTCAAAVSERLDEPGNQLLHWDLHYDNILAAEREPWLAIDPEPLAGDPGFDLLPALINRWDDVAASGDVTRAVRRRFDLLTARLALDRRRATGWTLGRVLQNALWDIEDGETAIDPAQVMIAAALLDPRGTTR